MRWLLRLYPRAWRHRYEEEMLALLEDHHVTVPTLIDLLLGAVDAHLHFRSFTEGVNSMVMKRLRSGIVMVFCAFMLFGVGWGVLQRLTDPLPYFQAVNSAHPEFRLLFDALFGVGCLSFLAFVSGGLPVFFISVRRALKESRQDVLFPAWVAVTCLVLFVTSTAMLALWHPQTHIYLILISYLVTLALLLVIGTTAVSLVVARTEFQVRELKFVYIPEMVILLCMVIAVVLSIILITLITAYAPQLFSTQDVNNPMFISGLVFMTMGTIFATLGLKRTMTKETDALT